MGGTYKDKFDTVQQAKDACSLDDTCVGFDIRKSAPLHCWFHYGTIGNGYETNTLDHYVKAMEPGIQR